MTRIGNCVRWTGIVYTQVHPLNDLTQQVHLKGKGFFCQQAPTTMKELVTIKYFDELQASAGADGLNESYEELSLIDLLSLFLSRLDK